MVSWARLQQLTADKQRERARPWLCSDAQQEATRKSQRRICEPPTFSQGVETSAAAVQGLALAPQASSADAPAPDEQDECATTDDE